MSHILTTYEKQLAAQIEGKYPDLTGKALFEKLAQIGVLDFSRCKVLAVRTYVEQLIKQGEKKSDAMWTASERFCCSYEYVRKCMYYYTDVNFA